MKILIVCNIVIPSVAECANIKPSVFGGWLSGHIDNLKKYKDIEMSVAFPYNKTSVDLKGDANGISYYSFKNNMPDSSYNLENRFKEIIGTVKPDVIHIFGTEYRHSLIALNAAEEKGMLAHTVISIQGLVSVYGIHFLAGLEHGILKRKTLRDFLKRSNILKEKKKFLKSGRLEIEAIEKCHNVIGRTDWDEACVKRINPNVKYFFCNESLRNAFYSGTWNLKDCEKHSIFISQCTYPVKGFHLMLQAFSDIVKKYPDAHLYVAGPEISFEKNFVKDQKMTYYRLYLKKLILKLGLEKNITFLGLLNENEMKQRFLTSHVFVSPSSIENSPNSLGEAMILGVPCVTSDVGGVKNMLTHGEEGFVYPFDEPYMAAYYISKIFDDDNIAQKISVNAKKHAEKTHNIDFNIDTAIKIYKEVNKKC